MKRHIQILAAAAMAACMAVPVMAEAEKPAEQTVAVSAEETAADEFTTADGVLTIKLPNNTWKEVNDPSRWAVLSDGTNTITIDHFANGEKLPEARLADDHYANVYQATFSTKNEVFIITGLVTEAESIPDVCQAIMSAKVNIYDTKTAVAKQAASPAGYTVREIGKTYYVISESVNVRLGCSTDDQIIGTLFYGNSVFVKGAVQQNGTDIGWMQIDYNNTTAYVYADFLSLDAPANNQNTQPAAPSVVYTGRVTTVYTEDGTPITIYEATDNYWYDGSGISYISTSEGVFRSSQGIYFPENRPVAGIYPTGNSVTVFWLNGNACTLQEYSNGIFYSDSMVGYSPTGGGTWLGQDGTVLYTSEQELGNYAPYETVYIESDDTGEIVAIESEGGDYMDDEGTLYARTDDGDYIDYFGNHYSDVDW